MDRFLIAELCLQSSDPVKPKDTEANISQSALEQLEQMTSAPGPSVQNLLQLLK